MNKDCFSLTDFFLCRTDANIEPRKFVMNIPHNKKHLDKRHNTVHGLNGDHIKSMKKQKNLTQTGYDVHHRIHISKDISSSADRDERTVLSLEKEI